MDYLALTIPGPDGPVQVKPPTGVPTGGRVALEFALRNGLIIVLTFLFVLALFVLIVSGIQWITSGGDKQALDAAKKRITYAIVGLIIAVSAFLIVNVLGGLFNLNLF